MHKGCLSSRDHEDVSHDVVLRRVLAWFKCFLYKSSTAVNNYHITGTISFRFPIAIYEK